MSHSYLVTFTTRCAGELRHGRVFLDTAQPLDSRESIEAAERLTARTMPPGHSNLLFSNLVRLEGNQSAVGLGVPVALGGYRKKLAESFRRILPLERGSPAPAQQGGMSANQASLDFYREGAARLACQLEAEERAHDAERKRAQAAELGLYRARVLLAAMYRLGQAGDLRRHLDDELRRTPEWKFEWVKQASLGELPSMVRAELEMTTEFSEIPLSAGRP